MIGYVETVDAAKTPVEWWGKVPGLQKRVDFAPTLNVLVGPNGSGKSMLILALARLFHCAQGELPTVTHASVRLIPDDLGLKVGHDGHLVFCMRSEEAIGLIGGMAGFDDDFFSEGMASIMRKKYSHGQQTLIRTPDFLKKIVTVPKVAWKLGKHPGAEADFRKAEDIRKFLETPTIQDWKRGTVLLDEPEDGLSLPMQAEMWHILNRVSQRFQVIVATQSPLAFAQRDALVIEMEDGFADDCRRTIVRQYEDYFAPEPKA